jgi:uncharacterized membrane-anchored protein
MFISGTLGTVIGDFCSHNMGLGDAGPSILLSPIAAMLFLAGRGGRLLLLPFYWLIVVLIRAAGTAVGDFISGQQHAWPAREHCRHGGSLHCRPGHLEGAVEIGERESAVAS